jgi:hypothetical protein
MNEQGVLDFLMKLAGDAAAAAGGLSVAIGDRLGLYSAMVGTGPLTAAELAERTGLVERYIQEWLAVQAGLGYVEYDPAGQSFTLPDEHAAVLADENSPAFLAGVFPVLRSLYATEDGLINAFRVGGGWAGTSTATRCTAAPPGCSGPGTARTSSAPGCPRWTASSSGCGPAPGSPTSAAASDTPRLPARHG